MSTSPVLAMSSGSKLCKAIRGETWRQRPIVIEINVIKRCNCSNEVEQMGYNRNFVDLSYLHQKLSASDKSYMSIL